MYLMRIFITIKKFNKREYNNFKKNYSKLKIQVDAILKFYNGGKLPKKPVGANPISQWKDKIRAISQSSYRKGSKYLNEGKPLTKSKFVDKWLASDCYKEELKKAEEEAKKANGTDEAKEA